MLLFKRPEKPEDFDAKMQPARDDVRANISESYDFSSKWTQYKSNFSEAQYKKCGYCEMKAIGAGYGDMDHFAPKGAIWSLKEDYDSRVVEKDHLANIEGRQKKFLSSTGYWWLAYEWDNYVLSCQVCNQAWKGAFFPVGCDDRKLPPEEGVVEDQLLLNPFDDEDPSDHLLFGKEGEVEARGGSIRGRETIRVYGLDRPSLYEDRQQLALETHELIREMKELDKKIRKLKREISEAQVEDPSMKVFKKIYGETLNKTLKKIYVKGLSRNAHPGMVRSIFENETGMSWQKLEEKFGPEEAYNVQQ